MFDVGFWEVGLIAVLALVILGPERLPAVARTAGLWIGRARRVMADVKADINREIDQEELRQIRNIGEDLKSVRDDVSQAGAELSHAVSQTTQDATTPSEAAAIREQSAVAQDAKAK